jgi:hypothetical protein
MKATDDKGVLLARREKYRSDEDVPPSDELAQAYAQVTPIYDELQSAPLTPFNGEPARDWQARAIGELRNKFPGGPHDGVPVRTLLDMDEGGFGQIWTDVVEHAWAAAQAWAPPGMLRARQVLRSGIPVTEYVGDEQQAWKPFLPPARAVKVMRGPDGTSITPNRAWLGKVAL